MDPQREVQNVQGRATYQKWVGLIAVAAALAAAAVVVRRRCDVKTQIARVIERCEAADNELQRRLAAA